MRIILFTLMLVVVGCSTDKTDVKSDRSKQATSTDNSADALKGLEGQYRPDGKGYLFSDDLEFEKIKISSSDGTVICGSNDQAVVDAVVQSIISAALTVEIDMEFPPNHFETYLVVDLIHANPNLNLKFRYDQGFVEPQHTPTMGMRWLSTGNALSKFIETCKIDHNAE